MKLSQRERERMQAIMELESHVEQHGRGCKLNGKDAHIFVGPDGFVLVRDFGIGCAEWAPQTALRILKNGGNFNA